MTKKFHLLLLTGVSILLFAACSKTPESLPQPVPGQPDHTAYLQLSANGVQFSGQQLYALLSIENKSGMAVVTNKKVTLDYIQGVYKTDKIALAKGEYSLSKFIVLKSSDTAAYATPRTNSPKAAQVTSPLSFSFLVAQKGINNSSVEVLKIAETDAAASFGYTAEDFGFQAHLNLNVKLKIRVGHVIYDSLPGKLKIDAVNGTENHWSREIDLKKGFSPVSVPEQYSTFTFEISKWNIVAKKVFSRSALQTGMMIELEAIRQPKRLVEEKSFIENSSGLVPDSRTEYFYNGVNRLSEIKNYQKSIQVSGLPLTNIYKFSYNGTILDSIKRFAADNSSTGYTAFTYNANRIANIHNRSYDQETGAAIEYLSAGDNEVINADYLFSNGNTMNYKIFFRDGNKISDQAQSSTGAGETGTYEYDENINPKHQLGWPDLYFSNASKNNITREQKGYGGGFPSAIPYKFEYTYDNDGYPAEVFISYKGYTSQQHLYRIRKVYIYQ